MAEEIQTPTDEPKIVPQEAPKKLGKRKRVLGQGEGDYCIYEIAQKDSDLPVGSLIPIPEVPRFEDGTAAIKWIRQWGAEKLTGKQVMVFRAMDILTIRVQTKPTVLIDMKPKVSAKKPKVEPPSES